MRQCRYYSIKTKLVLIMLMNIDLYYNQLYTKYKCKECIFTY